MTTQCMIQGFYWTGNPLKTHLFQFVGIIQLADDGTFQGTVKDYYNKAAVIKGKIERGVLEFVKNEEPPRGSKVPIYYLLRPQGFGEPGETLLSGWRGAYMYQSPNGQESKYGGEASCMIFPLS